MVRSTKDKDNYKTHYEITEFTLHAKWVCLWLKTQNIGPYTVLGFIKSNVMQESSQYIFG